MRAPALVWMCWKVEGPCAIGQWAVGPLGGEVPHRPSPSGSNLDAAKIVYSASTWVVPILIAITFHEAAHAFTAWRLGMIRRSARAASRSIPSSIWTRSERSCFQHCYS